MIRQKKNKQLNRYTHLSDAPMPVIIASGNNLLVDYANKKGLTLMQQGSGKVIGSPLNTLLPSIFSFEVVKEVYRKCFVEESGQTLDGKQVILSDGANPRMVWYNITINPIQDDEGRPVAAILFFTNVTDQLIAKKSIDQRSEFLSNFFKKAPVGLVCYRGPEFIVDLANEKALEMWGKTSEQVIGKRLAEIFPEVKTDPKISARHSESMQRMKRGEAHVVDEVELVFPRDGIPQSGWYSYIHEPYTDGAGRIIGMIAVAIDVTEQVLAKRKSHQKLESEVRERTAELSKINELLVGKIGELNDTQAVLQQLVDSSIEYIALVDKDLKILLVNKPVERLTNKSRAELVGTHIFDAYEAIKSSEQLAALEKALAGDAAHLRINPSISRPNLWFDTHYVPLVINNRVEGVIALSRDISEIVKSEQELANVNRQLAEAQRLAKLGSWEWDVATGSVLWSDEMYRIYGYNDRFAVDFVRATERMSHEDAEASSRRTQQHIQLAIDHFKRTRELVYEIPSIEFPIRLPGGEQKWVRNSGKIQLTTDGKLHRVLGVVQDVTHIRSAEEQLRILVSELEFKNKELESFNYIASHDLQEPLRKIQTFIDRIKNVPMEQQALGEYLLRINNSAQRMHDLLHSMLILSRLSNAADGFTEVDLNATLLTCKSDLELVIREKNATVKSDPLPVVVASTFQMSQLFGNLISNALKFCKEAPEIRITCEKVAGSEIKQHKTDPSNAYWCLSFVDNGIGFDSRYKDLIFELFQRLHSRNEFNGTGIGLSIVKRIVERHKGFIEADSEPGKGARFSVWLPCN